MFKVKVFVSLKEGILDPEGVAVQGSLHRLGFQEVKNVRMGKDIELIIDSNANLDERIKEMCEKLLTNIVIEDYSYEIEEVSIS